MPPSTFFLSGLVKVSEKRRHQCQGPRGGGRDLNCFRFQGHLQSPEYPSKGKEHTLVVAGHSPIRLGGQASTIQKMGSGGGVGGWGAPATLRAVSFHRKFGALLGKHSAL